MFRAPTQAGLPPLRLMTADIPTSPDRIARHLDISPRTFARYLTAEQAPRAIMLALFWETRWGRSAADCEAANYGAVHAGLAHALARENAILRKQISTMESMMGNRAANTPFFRTGSETAPMAHHRG